MRAFPQRWFLLLTFCVTPLAASPVPGRAIDESGDGRVVVPVISAEGIIARHVRGVSFDQVTLSVERLPVLALVPVSELSLTDSPALSTSNPAEL